MNQRVLVISDMHIPFEHKDAFDFLAAIKLKHKPDRVICIGDEIDGHAISFHNHDPDLLSPGDELELAIKRLRILYKLFPVVELVESNHGSLVYRKGKFHGLPRHVFKSYREVLDAPRTWVWHKDLTIQLPNGQSCYFHHGLSAKQDELSRRKSMCSVQGHFHSKFDISYWGNSFNLYWDMHVGCLIDDDSMAFAYNKTTLARPVIGVGLILSSQPLLVPMVLAKGNRWVGKL